MAISLRRAKLSDAALLFRLRTEAITMMYAVGSYASRWSQHLRNLEGELADPDHVVFVAEDGKDTVGSVTMDLSREGAIELTWIIAAEHRHRGVAAGMVEEAVRLADAPIAARIHPDDAESQKLAESFGMELISDADGFTYWRTADAAPVLPLRPRIFNE